MAERCPSRTSVLRRPTSLKVDPYTRLPLLSMMTSGSVENCNAITHNDCPRDVQRFTAVDAATRKGEVGVPRREHKRAVDSGTCAYSECIREFRGEGIIPLARHW